MFTLPRHTGEVGLHLHGSQIINRKGLCKCENRVLKVSAPPSMWNTQLMINTHALNTQVFPFTIIGVWFSR